MEKIKAAAYCRVSTDKEEQDGSYEIQEQYFADLINSDLTMELVGIYGDKGKSGLSTKKRPGLQKLMDDCRAGKINRIYTKSIARFARNMAECAGMINELGDLGVSIIFEEQGLDSQDEGSRLILNIFSAIAQEESYSISKHTKMAHEQRILEGRPFGAISFGYKNGGNGEWVIDEDAAPRVKKAFQMALEGRSYSEIRMALNEMESDGRRWGQQRLKYMLTNVVYKGDYMAYKTVCLVPGKQVVNNNFRDRIYIEEHHEPIVSPQLFDCVQEIINRGILLSYKRPSREDEEFLKGVANGNSNEN